MIRSLLGRRTRLSHCLGIGAWGTGAKLLNRDAEEGIVDEPPVRPELSPRQVAKLRTKLTRTERNMGRSLTRADEINARVERFGNSGAARLEARRALEFRGKAYRKAFEKQQQLLDELYGPVWRDYLEAHDRPTESP